MLQNSLGAQAAATQPYRTAAQAEAGKPHNSPSARPAVPQLAIVLMCAGTRGDVQPFIALALQLQVYNLHLSLWRKVSVQLFGHTTDQDWHNHVVHFCTQFS